MSRVASVSFLQALLGILSDSRQLMTWVESLARDGTESR